MKKINKTLFEKLRAWCSRPSIGCYAPPSNPSASNVDFLYEELHYYNEEQLSELLAALGGGHCANKDAALDKLRDLVAKTFGGYVPVEPKFIVVNRDRNATKSARKRAKSSLPEEMEDAQSEESTMSKAAIKQKPSKTAKIADAKTKAKKSKADVARVGKPAKDRVTVASIVRAGIAAKKDNEAILADVKKKMPGAKTTLGNVSWYRWKEGQ